MTTTKPIIFKPKLHAPQGINNYSGEVFRCFTNGDTLSFEFTLQDEDGDAIDTSGVVVSIVMSDKLVTDSCDNESQQIDVTIPLFDADTAVFKGEINSAQTESLPNGLIYAMAKYTVDGTSHIIDMCLLEVYPSLICIS